MGWDDRALAPVRPPPRTPGFLGQEAQDIVSESVIESTFFRHAVAVRLIPLRSFLTESRSGYTHV
ncbi:hypothetical protein GCM10018782_32220 [Streptomyces griseoaurantiacus]|nr:hypothetical protein GCM10018782_32220 [Streptomyces griseoaurantiacus]